MMLLQLAVAFGTVLGYGMAAIVTSFTNWRYCFYLQVVLMIPVLVIMISFPKNYLSYEESEEDI